MPQATNSNTRNQSGVAVMFATVGVINPDDHAIVRVACQIKAAVLRSMVRRDMDDTVRNSPALQRTASLAYEVWSAGS